MRKPYQFPGWMKNSPYDCPGRGANPRPPAHTDFIKKNNNTLPNMIDGKLGNENISDVFVDKYKSLYNSVSYDNHDMNNLLLKLNDIIECVAVACGVRLSCSVLLGTVCYCPCHLWRALCP